MKKIIFGVTLLLILILVIHFLVVRNNLTSYNNTPNAFLTTINYAVQIEYNISYLIIALVVLFIAESQLNKTREATTIQTLTNIATNLKSEYYLKNRVELAKFISDKGKDHCGNFILRNHLKELKELEITDEDQNIEIAIIKNKFESVIYDFEILGYYLEKGIYNKEDIYQLFSYEIEYFWVLVTHLGFIDYLRFNKKNGEEDFYDKFEALFNCTLKHEVLKSNNLNFSDKLFYKLSIDKIFQSESKNVSKAILTLQEKRQSSIDIFLCEEKYLLNGGLMDKK